MHICTCTTRQDKPCLIHPYDCAADKLTRAIERIQQLKSKLTEVANIAHHGGLTGHGTNDIRRITLPYWNTAECDRLQKETDNE